MRLFDVILGQFPVAGLGFGASQHPSLHCLLYNKQLEATIDTPMESPGTSRYTQHNSWTSVWT